MTKIHDKISKGPQPYSYYVVKRSFGSLQVFVVVNAEYTCEMAPVFDNLITAMEIAEKASNNEMFFNGIPVVPFNTPYPRPVNSWLTPQEFRDWKEGREKECT